VVNFTTAELTFESVCQALKINPRRQEAWNNLGILQRDAGEYEAQKKKVPSYGDLM